MRGVAFGCRFSFFADEPGELASIAVVKAETMDNRGVSTFPIQNCFKSNGEIKSKDCLVATATL
jgi:hypothetical protein